MRTKLAIVVVALSLAKSVFAHRLDEYLQAIIVSIEQGQIHASMRLIPGVAVSNVVLAEIDLNGDGLLSPAEQRAYAQEVLHELTLSLDGKTLTLHLRSFSFPAVAEMKEGTGEIHIEFASDLPAAQSRRSLVIENHHEPSISIYLMNSLIPQDRRLQIVGQTRNQNQSYYRVEYVQSNAAQSWLPLESALSNFEGMPNMFRLGMRHISKGTDHLLFLIALLLPAPLLAGRSRWAAAGGFRYSLIRISRVVTAFTLGHSLTLALGASGLVSIPEGAVEALIAFSILISAAHALRPLFPGREPIIAAGFGLVHGLAFATTLHNLGVTFWQRVASILGFNLGIETMQLIVVAAVLPSLIILSRTPAYTGFRLFGGWFAAIASLGWIMEVLFAVPTFVDVVVNQVAQRGVWIAFLLLIISLVAWLLYARQESGKFLSSSQPSISL